MQNIMILSRLNGWKRWNSKGITFSSKMSVCLSADLHILRVSHPHNLLNKNCIFELNISLFSFVLSSLFIPWTKTISTTTQYSNIRSIDCLYYALGQIESIRFFFHHFTSIELKRMAMARKKKHRTYPEQMSFDASNFVFGQQFYIYRSMFSKIMCVFSFEFIWMFYLYKQLIATENDITMS